MVFILALVGVYYYLANSATIPNAFATNVLDQSTTVYYSDGIRCSARSAPSTGRT